MVCVRFWFWGRDKVMKEREQIKRRWWGNLWDNLYFHLPSPQLGYCCCQCRHGLAAEQCLQKGQCWGAAWVTPSVLVLPKERHQITLCKSSSEGRHGHSSDLERKLISLYHFTSPHVLMLLCYCRSTKGMTLKLAGNNHLVPVPRVTDDDIAALVPVLYQAAFVTGKVFPCVFDIAVLIQENMISLDFTLSSSLFLFMERSVQCRYAFLILHFFQVWILPIIYWLMLEHRS